MTLTPTPTTSNGETIPISVGGVRSKMFNNEKLANQITRAKHLVITKDMEALFREYMQRNDALLQSQASSIKNLELQLGQLANDVSERPKGALLCNTKTPIQRGGSSNKKSQLVTLRSRRNLTIHELESEQ
ncbi:hypothetical protein Csa_008461 [Cucumis sativus]|uniref:Uncharacterized protein n=1 Tax=Cucumis sativus TaxID=3659 RepID=A0A0A0KN83_CUCSA|nr:hypothetical protein Csa_008461 [Cucumis sativus]